MEVKMNLWFLVPLIATCVMAEDSALLDPCNVEDIDCLGKSTEKFLKATHQGIPQYDILPIDPKILPEVVLDFGEDVVKPRLTDVNVTGMQDQRIYNFKMDTKAKTVLLQVTMDLEISSKIAIESSTKTYNGQFHGSGKYLVTASYPYDLKTMPDGKDHFVVGDETIECASNEVPAIHYDFDTQQLPEDTEAVAARRKYEERQDEVLKKGGCKIVKLAYVAVVHNIRAAAKILPAAAFFKNL